MRRTCGSLRLRTAGRQHRLCEDRDILDLGANLREIVDAERLAVAQHHRPEYGVFELPDVARPIIGLEQGERCAGHHSRLERGLAARESSDKMLDDRLDVVASVPERRHEDRKDVETIEQVFPEQAVAHPLQEIAMGRRYKPDVDLDRAACSDRIDLAVVHRAQQLHLDFGRQIADLVEKQRARMRFDELAGMFFGGAGKGALLVPEQDALDQIRAEWRRNSP